MNKLSYNYKDENVVLNFASSDELRTIVAELEKVDGVFNINVSYDDGHRIILGRKPRYMFHYVIDANENGACWEYTEFSSDKEAMKWAKSMKVITGELLDRATGKRLIYSARGWLDGYQS